VKRGENMKLTMHDYFTNAGLVGMYQVLERTHLVEVKQSGFELSASSIEGFAESFFDTLLEKFDVAEQDRRRMTKQLSFARKEKAFTNAKKSIQQRIKQNLVKCKKAEIDALLIIKIEGILEQMKLIKKYEQLKELEILIEEYLQILKEEVVNNVLTLNYIRYVLGILHGQVSFLNPSFKGSKEEYVAKFETDFLMPVREELKLLEERQLIAPGDRLEWYKSRQNDNELTKVGKQLLKTLYKQEAMYGRFVPCSIFPDVPGLLYFEEKMFYPLGLSLDNAENMKWNGVGGLPISYTASLILFCSSLGMLFFNKRLYDSQYVGVAEYQPFFSFINADTSFSEMLRLNRQLHLKHDKENPFEELIIDSVLDETKEISRWTLENLLYVEFGVEKKNTKLHYFHIPRRLADYFTAKGQLMTLSRIQNPRFRYEIVSLLLHQQEPLMRIHRQLHESVLEKRIATDCFIAIKNHYVVRHYLKGVKDVEQKVLDSFFSSGIDMRRSYYKDNQLHQLEGVCLRLLNATQSNNKRVFMDTLLRMYVAKGKIIRKEMMQLHHESEVSFQEAAQCFIAGLNGYIKEEQQKKVEENE